MTQELYVYGLSEDALRHRLAELLHDPVVGVTFSVIGGRSTVTLTAEAADMTALREEVSLRLMGYVYSDTDPSLAAAVVPLLAEHGLTVATAESCTGGLIAAALTDVPGASRVFGTGVVSYSNGCKEKLLAVSQDTLTVEGAVSAATAGQMARGVRRSAEAAIGLSVTGEAGPIPAENHPVGTVFIALADAKRTWVEECRFEGDRSAIRRAAADRVLWLLWRYLSAYPAVMAGGESHRAAQKREIPRTKGAMHPRLLSRILPWRGDSRRRLCVKWTALITALAVAVGCLWAVYQYLWVPDRNRQLQDSLVNLYYESTDLTQENTADSAYPEGMLAVFRGLYDMNEDVGGWIHIPNTGIDYPVMQYADAYYRNHSFDKEYSIYGQPYLDERFSLAHPRMQVIHGRNTGDGQMFSDLLNYRRVAYLQEHPVIQLDTLYGTARWQIFAVCVRDSRDEDRFNLQEEPKDYEDFVDALMRRSLFHSDLTVTAEDSLLLLTVNAQREYGFNGAQLVIAARLTTGAEEETVYRVNNRAQMPAALGGTTTTTRTTRATRVTTTTTSGDGTTTTITTTPSGSVTDATESTTVPEGSTTIAEDVTSTTEGEATTTQPTDLPEDPSQDEDDNGEDNDYIGN